ncbi:UNVERIFIED_CONTAM: hypothetical protein Cloal_2098 [Acetivibrio alkalicellulosi]
MDSNFKKFIFLSGAVILISLAFVAIFGAIYYFSTINTYNMILLFLILMTIIITLFFFLSAFSIYIVYKKKTKNKLYLTMAKAGLNTLLPLVMLIASFFKTKKDPVRKFYIDFNNLMVNMLEKKYRKDDIMVLLPHCLQYSDCGYKVTNDISNCKNCGKCTVGDIFKACQEKGVKSFVLTGGTAARNIVPKYKPKVILAVACERDLTSGIIDVVIPVIGIINDRPNGPCYNTRVDVNVFKEKLDSIIKE